MTVLSSHASDSTDRVGKGVGEGEAVAGIGDGVTVVMVTGGVSVTDGAPLPPQAVNTMSARAMRAAAWAGGVLILEARFRADILILIDTVLVYV